MSNANVLEITDANFEETALRAPTPVLIDFTAAWCAPCRTIAPHIDAIADSYQGRLRVGKCDVDANQALVTKLDVRAMPTLIVLKDGRVVGQMVGAAPRAKIEALVNRALGA
jgi:thioredoxin 1